MRDWVRTAGEALALFILIFGLPWLALVVLP